jgi:hypothetical protein
LCDSSFIMVRAAQERAAQERAAQERAAQERAAQERGAHWHWRRSAPRAPLALASFGGEGL